MKGIIIKVARPLWLSLFSLGVGSALASAGSGVSLKVNAPQNYQVEKGDTLWDISALYLDSPWLWPKLWHANPSIDNPHLIYPGDKLTLSWRDGEPVLSLKPHKTLSPQARIHAKQALPALSETLLLPYLNFDRLLSSQQLQQASQVLGTQDGRQFLSRNDRIYIQGSHSELEWEIYRPIETHHRQGHTQSVMSLKLVASATLVQEKSESQTDVSALALVSQQQEVKVGDIALVKTSPASAVSTPFFPTPAPSDVSAAIVGFIDGGNYAALNQVVIIDRGESDEVHQGNMFQLAMASGDGAFLATESSMVLPSVVVGELMVIRAYSHFSLAIITQSKQPISREVKVLPPRPSVTPEQV